MVATILAIGLGTYDVIKPFGASRPLGVIILVGGLGLGVATLFEILKEKRSTFKQPR